MICLWLALLASIASAQIDPKYAVSLTVYHLHPNSTGSIPIDMDTGDAPGDLFFYLTGFLLPLECANATPAPARHGLDCDNPERIDPNLVLTKVELQIDSRFTTYSACNVCNGTDPISGKTCKIGSYVCNCFGQDTACNSTQVGKMDVKAKFGPGNTTAKCSQALSNTCGSTFHSPSCATCVKTNAPGFIKDDTCQVSDLLDFCSGSGHFGDQCNASSLNWECWRSNLPMKTAGFWYSTLADGRCQEDSADGSCGWKVLSTTSVLNTCVKNNIMTVAEDAGHDCFTACGLRNASSPCWMGCFFDTILGPKAWNSSEVAGMPLETIVGAFTEAFLPEEQNGCAKVNMGEGHFMRGFII